MSIQHAAMTALIIAAVWSGPQRLTADEDDPKSTRSKRVESAERVFKRFLVAMISADEQTLLTTSLPNDDIKLLLLDERPPAIAVSAFKSRVQESRVRLHKSGERIALATGKTFLVTPDLVSKDRKVLSLVALPIPLSVVRTEGVWKVDAAPIIAARRAAANAKAELVPAQE